MAMSGLISIVLLSIKVAVIATLFALPFGFAIAFVMSTFSFRGKIILEILINLPLALPPVVIGTLIMYLLHPHSLLGMLLEKVHLSVLFTWKAAVLSAMIVGFPLLVRAIRINLDHIDLNLIRTARSLGAGAGDVIWSVVLPLAYPGVLAGALMMFVRSIGEFGATVMVAGNIPGKTQTLSLAIYEYANTPYGEHTALLLSGISMAVAITVLAVYDRLMRRFLTGGE